MCAFKQNQDKMSVCLPTLGCSRRAWDWETYFKLPGHFHTALDIHMAKRTWQDNINSLIGNPAYRHPSSNRRKWKQDDKNHWTTTHFLSRDRHTPCDHWTYDLLAVASTKGSMKSWKRCFNFELEPKSQDHVLTPRHEAQKCWAEGESPKSAVPVTRMLDTSRFASR